MFWNKRKEEVYLSFLDKEKVQKDVTHLITITYLSFAQSIEKIMNDFEKEIRQYISLMDSPHSQEETLRITKEAYHQIVIFYEWNQYFNKEFAPYLKDSMKEINKTSTIQLLNFNKLIEKMKDIK